MAEKKRIVIIGAGPTGLGAAYRLSELGISDYVVVEASPHVGGLASSFVDAEGFTWDIGGHVQFSHYSYFDELMKKALGPDGWHVLQREAWAWMHDRFVPYPVQNNIRLLPKESMWRCLQGLIELYKHPTTRVPANFREWILQTFGEGLAHEFMLPYNFKVWAHPPEDMSWSWIGERVAITDLTRVTENIIFEKDDLSWGPNNTFQFPKSGGTGGIWSAVAQLSGVDRIRLNARVQQVDSERREVMLSSGEIIGYEALISTMPVDLLATLLRPGAHSLVAAGQKLRRSATHVVGLGLRGQPSASLATKCWMYFPEGNCPFYRSTVFSNYSASHVPNPGRQWSLMTETSESAHKPVARDRLVEETIAGCLNTKLIESRDQVVSTWTFRAEHGYPTPSVDRDVALKQLMPELERRSIFSRGRFGGWKYEVSNQDHSLMQGVEIVNRLVLSIPETTYRFPATANANWGR